MERRVLLAIFLSFLVLYVYQALLPKPAPVPPSTAGQPQAAKQTADNKQLIKPDTGQTAAAAQLNVETKAPVAAVVFDTAERDVPLDTDTVSAVFTNRGGVLKSWKLKSFRDEAGPYHNLIPQGLPPGFARPFSVRLPDAGLSQQLNSALFRVDASSPGTIRFDYENAAGLKAHKEFHLDPHSYLLSTTVSVGDRAQQFNPVLDWGPALGPLTTDAATSRYVQRSEGIVYLDGDVKRLNAGAIAKQSAYQGPIVFGGVDDQYFLAAFVRPGSAKVEYHAMDVPAPGANAQPPVALVAYDMQINGSRWPQKVFIGPKDFDVLKAVDPNLVRAVNFGRFSFLVVPLLTSLKWLNGFIGNYGWSIIALTVLINAVMFPLRHKSVVSMRKLQEIQPEVKGIQDRYGKLKTTDPAKQKMNTELMNLYRERGVNPASGCIPMLLTMPVLFAFYSLLSAAVELRGAPFVGWITDLSAHDPLYITPVLMGATMVVQQRMTPSTLDPVQAKMMMVMPLVFTFMFLRAPSGLVLYWLVSNLWAIGQQQLTNRMIGPPVVRNVRPPAERKLKKAGAGKTEAAEKGE